MFAASAMRTKQISEKAKRQKRQRTLDASSKDGVDGVDITHDEACFVCGKGGRLVCCDACSNVAHLQCATPVIKKLPRGDWFCKHCTKRLYPDDDDVAEPQSTATGPNPGQEQTVTPPNSPNISPYRSPLHVPDIDTHGNGPTSPGGKKHRKCGLCGEYGGHNARSCKKVKPVAGDYFEWGGEDIYIIDKGCVRHGQGYFTQFHKYGESSDIMHENR